MVLCSLDAPERAEALADFHQRHEGNALVIDKWFTLQAGSLHRDVLDHGDIIHLRRPNGRDWDGILHANPSGREKGLACLYNPLNEPITREIRLPLRYTGLRGSARVSRDGASPETIQLTADHEAVLKVAIPAQGRAFLLFTE